MAKDIKVNGVQYDGAKQVELPLADGTGTARFYETSGDTTPEKVLEGETFHGKNGEETGTMPDNGTVTETIGSKDTVIAIEKGYHTGGGKVSLDPEERAKLVPENIMLGEKILGVPGNGDISARVADWLAAHIGPTSPAVDDSLTVRGAAADAKKTGQEISSKPNHSDLVCVDEHGNVFANANEMAAWEREYRDKPCYKQMFGDYVPGYWYKSGENYVYSEARGICTRNHPLPYDPTMVLKVAGPVEYVRVYTGYLDGGEFVLVGYHVYSQAAINLRMYEQEFPSGKDPYICFAVDDRSVDDLNGVVELYTKNHKCTLVFAPRMTISNTEQSKNIFVKTTGNLRNIRYYSDAAINPETGESYSARAVVGGAAYLYADGHPIDAIFYDRNGAELPGAVGDLGEPVDWGEYPVMIEVPKAAASFRFAVYGLRRSGGKFIDLGVNVMEVLPKVGFYCDAARQGVGSFHSGVSVKNAYDLCNLVYKCDGVPVRNYNLNYPRLYDGKSFGARARGFPYSIRSNPGYHHSFYTFLSSMCRGHGVTVENAPIETNYWMGYTCASLMSSICGIEWMQGTEWWLQNYHDRLKLLTRDTELQPGDILVATVYRYCAAGVSYGDTVKYDYTVITNPTPERPVTAWWNNDEFDQRRSATVQAPSPKAAGLYEWVRTNDSPLSFELTNDEEIVAGKQYFAITSPDRFRLDTHIRLVVGKVNNPETGVFVGYEVAESYNVWTRLATLQSLFGKNYWYMRNPMYRIKPIGESYRYAIDKTVDPLHNSAVTFPPLLSYVGDMCMVGTTPPTPRLPLAPEPDPDTGIAEWGWGTWYLFPSTKNAATAGYLLKDYDVLTIKRDGSIIAEDVSVSSLPRYSDGRIAGLKDFSLADYLSDPGEYEIYSGVSGDTGYKSDPAVCSHFMIPHYPRVRWDNKYKRVTIDGDLSDFDELWFRVMPYPVVVDGYPQGTPWSNYIYVPADELLVDDSGDNTRIYDVGNKYRYITSIQAVNNTYGSVECRLRKDYTPVVPEGEDETDPEE